MEPCLLRRSPMCCITADTLGCVTCLPGNAPAVLPLFLRPISSAGEGNFPECSSLCLLPGCEAGGLSAMAVPTCAYRKYIFESCAIELQLKVVDDR